MGCQQAAYSSYPQLLSSKLSSNRSSSSSSRKICLKKANQTKSLFSNYQSINEPIISEIVSSVPDTFTEAVNLLSRSYTASNVGSGTCSSRRTADGYVLDNRKELGKFIEGFHSQAGTITPEVKSSIGALNSPTTEIFVSTHQPNLFAYSGVFKKIVLLQTLQQTLEKKYNYEKFRIVNLFLIIDHDFMDENWIRVAQLPSVRHSSGILELRLPVDDSIRWKLVCNMALPGRTILNRWKQQIVSWIRKSSSSMFSSSSSLGPTISKSQFLDNLEQFWKLVEVSYSRAKTYSDFNAFLMSEIVNSIWHYDTLFVRISDLSSVFQNGYKFLISNFNTYSDVLRATDETFRLRGISSGVSPNSYLNSPLWLHCKCGSKAPTKPTNEDLGQKHELKLEGKCMGCKSYLSISLGEQQRQLKGGKQEDPEQHGVDEYKHSTSEDNHDEALHGLSPRAIPIPLLLSRELGITCYTSGTDGMRYIIYGSRLFRELSINTPLIMVWPARDLYSGFAQIEALDLLQLGKQSDISRLIRLLKQRNAEYELKIGPVIAQRTRRVKAAQPVEDILSNLFLLKEEQRKIRALIKIAEKVKNAVEMRPCIIDYAINFGLENTEMQWRQNILNHDSLDAAVMMTV
jgi:hypothetical protein